jgi:hypothetical protein
MDKIVVVLRFDDVYRYVFSLKLFACNKRMANYYMFASLVINTDKRNKSDKNSYETRHQHGKPELIIE